MNWMSFALTVPQVRNRTKDVTRRLGWQRLRPGDVVGMAEKTRGVSVEKRIVLGYMRVVSARHERLDAITAQDVVREGFPGMTTEQFIEFFCDTHDCDPDTTVTRIEFAYVEDVEIRARKTMTTLHNAKRETT